MLVKWRSSSFDITSYTDSSDQKRQVKHHFVAEKRKVLRALANSKARVVAPQITGARHIENCAQRVARLSEALNVATATPEADALVVVSEAGKGMGEKSKGQKLNQLDAAGAS